MRKSISLALLFALMIGLAAAQTPAPIAQTEAGKKALTKIRQLGGLALELAQNDQHLEVSYIQTDGKFSDEHLAVLKDLKGLVHLDLRGQPVTDAQTVHLKPLTELTHLHLEKTKITDKGLENLKGLVHLEYLNLYGTAVSDAGLANLEGMKKLKHLYVWQTKVTEAGAAKLKKAIAGLDVNLGFKDEPIIAKKDDKKPQPKVVAKKPEPKKDDKKPQPKVVAKKDDKKPEPKAEVKKPAPPKDSKAADEITPLLKARLALAERAYRETYQKLGQTRRVGNNLFLMIEKPEDVYVWSVRWLHAKRDLSPKPEDRAAALEAHLKRMTELKKVFEDLSRDMVPRFRVDEAEWYRLEAQLWLAEFKKANPGVKVSLNVKVEAEPKIVLPKPVEKQEEKRERKPEPKKEAKKPEPQKVEKTPEPAIGAKKPEATKDPNTATEITTLLKARAALAEKSYRGSFEGLTVTKRFGNATGLVIQPETVYTWSVHWLEAQRDLRPKSEDQIAALQAHLKRMVELKERVQSLSLDLLPRTKRDEAEWYLLEAQLWLAKAKQAKAK